MQDGYCRGCVARDAPLACGEELLRVDNRLYLSLGRRSRDRRERTRRLMKQVTHEERNDAERYGKDDKASRLI
jgi:hypothetical protein